MKEITMENLVAENPQALQIGLCELPEPVQKLYQEALEKDEVGEFEEVIRKCQIILDKYPEFLDGQILLGRAYVYMNQADKALTIFEKVNKIWPDDAFVKAYMATAYQCLGEHKKAIKLFREVYPMEQYHQWLAVCYATALEQSKDIVTRRKVYLDMIQAYFDNQEADALMVNGAFARLFQTDQEFDRKTIQEDVQRYVRFLYVTTEMNEELKKNILGLVAAFSRYLVKRHMRESFVLLLENLESHLLFRDAVSRNTIDSGYCALESYYLNEEPKVKPFTVRLMNSFFEIAFSEDEDLKRDLPLYKLCILRCMPKILDEFTLMEEYYPHTWALFSDLVKEIQTGDAEDLRKKYEKEAKEAFPVSSLKDIRDEVTNLYEQATEEEQKEAEKILRSMGKTAKKKVGRNDLCPCGSGKKYKNCCGKN
jgi:tetratricopeptide (TPR) repeat protein